MLYICIRTKTRDYLYKMAKLKDILFGVIILLTVGLAVYSVNLSHKMKTLLGQAPTVITDTVTLTDVQFDTIFICSYTRDTLAVVDTAFIYDTLTQTYYATVEVPISSFVLDTSISFCSNFSDTLTVGIFERVNGYKVALDTLILDLKGVVSPVPLVAEKKFRVVPAVGLGYGTGGWGVFGGVGLSYW